MNELKFKRAYQRGIQAAGVDYQWYWRVNVGLWCAKNSVELNGDFVEFGVNKGFMSSAIMNYINWNELDKKTFFLLDTFEGIDSSTLTQQERELGYSKNSKVNKDKVFYTSDFEEVKKNFSEFKNVNIIKGSVPSTLNQIYSEKICFAHIDMNNVAPEVEALKFLSNKLVKGGFILLDDYAYTGYFTQKYGIDEVCKDIGFNVLSLPTGQGLVVNSS